jgi:hypothetical protein
MAATRQIVPVQIVASGFSICMLAAQSKIGFIVIHIKPMSSSPIFAHGIHCSTDKDSETTQSVFVIR